MRRRRRHQRRAPRDPFLVSGEPDHRQLSEHTAVPRLVPEDLLVVRAGRHHHAPARLGSASAPTPDFAVASFEDVVVPREDGFRCCHLRHGAVIRAMPARVLTRMARLTGPRRHVAVAFELDRPAGHPPLRHHAIAPRDRRRPDNERNRQDSQKNRAIPSHKCGRL